MSSFVLRWGVLLAALVSTTAAYTFDNHWLLQGTRIVGFEFRNQSQFARSTLLTSSFPNAAGIPTDIYDRGVPDCAGFRLRV